MTDMHDVEQDGFPSDAPEIVTTRVAAKPFGHDKAHQLMVREEALRTMTRQEAFNRGYLTVKDMDDEELRYGRCRDQNGYIPAAGKNTRELIPQDKYDDMVAEHEFRFKERMRQNLDRMLEVMVKVATDDTVEPRDQFEAAKYLFERVAGRTPETVNVTVKQAPWEGVLNDISGIGAISRAEHRRLSEQGNAGIIDVEVVDEDGVPPEGVPQDGEGTPEPDVVPVHKPRPDQSNAFPTPEEARRPADAPQRPLIRKDPDGPEPSFERDPAKPSLGPDAWAAVQVDEPAPEDQYGSRRTEARSYADQARDAASLQARRKEAKDRIQGAKKARRIARAMGADAITDPITDATVDDEGRLNFEQ